MFMATASNNPFQMLTEIDADTLAHLLTDVHADAALWPSQAATPQSTLDQFLLSLRSGEVVEIQGPPASAKTHLLYYILAIVVTPPSYHGRPTGGWGKAAIVFDMDHSFNAVRLLQIISSYLASRFGLTPLADIRAFARGGLERLHVFRPDSSSQLAATLLGLPKYHATHLPSEQIGLVAIDPVSAHYWPDRYKAEQVKRDSTPLHHVRQCLENFRRTHGNITVVTSWNLQTRTSPTATGPAQITTQKTTKPASNSVLPLAYHIAMESTEPIINNQVDEVLEIPSSQGSIEDIVDKPPPNFSDERRNSFIAVVKAIESGEEKQIRLHVTSNGILAE